MQILNHRVYGDPAAEPVYILHGVFGMLDNWHLFANQLAEHKRVITCDARNHGKSVHHADATYPAMAEDLFRLMDHLGDRTASILGHSMGGKTAMKAADLQPERINRLVVVDIAPKAYIPGHLRYFEAFKSIDFAQMGSRREADEAFTRYAPELSVRQFLLKNMEPLPEGGYRLKVNVSALEAHYPEIIGGMSFERIFDKPSLFVKGAKSAYIKSEDEAYILQHFPQAQFAAVEGAGHWVHAENPAGFYSCVEPFLRG
ncbi:MAG: alpha/beta fold hydrolase [Bacteroidia bacterium]